MSVDAGLLETIPLFAGLRDEDRSRVAEVADEVSVPAEAEIVSERDFSYHFYAIAEGAAEVRHDGRMLATLGPGDFFGEVGMLVTGRRTASVTALEPTRLVALFDRPFRRLEAEVPAFSVQVRAALGERGWSTGSEGERRRGASDETRAARHPRRRLAACVRAPRRPGASEAAPQPVPVSHQASRPTSRAPAPAPQRLYEPSSRSVRESRRSPARPDRPARS